MVESHAPAPWTVAAALVGCAWLLAPRGVPLRALGRASGSCRSSPSRPRRPRAGEAWVDVLDVGNGLAVVVRTASHALVYDAGPAWSEEADSGNRIVVPFLRGEGVSRLDGLVVSHADDDHAGGAISVAAARDPRVAAVVACRPSDALQTMCRRFDAVAKPGQRWTWDGVEFAVLHPARRDLRRSAGPQGAQGERPQLRAADRDPRRRGAAHRRRRGA